MTLPIGKPGRENLGDAKPRDPLSLGIILITVAETIGGVAIGFEAAALVGALALGTAVVGASFAMSKTMGAKQQGAGETGVGSVNNPGQRATVRQPAPSVRRAYGNCEIGGALSFTDDKIAGYLVVQWLLSDRRLSRIRHVKIGTNVVPFAELVTGEIMEPLAPFGGMTDTDYSNALRISIGEGRPDQEVDPLLLELYPTLGDSFRQRGIARMTGEFFYGGDDEIFRTRWGGGNIPNLLLGVSGSPVYNPADPTQRYVRDWSDRDDVQDAMRSWKFSRVASLIQADWGGDPLGIAIAPDRIRWDEVAKAAEFDGETIYNRDGSASIRYPLDGLVTMDQDPRTIMEAMLTANRGFFVTMRGRGWVQSSRPLEPVFTITDDDLIEGFRFRDDQSIRDVTNIVRTKIPAVDRQDQDVDIPVLRRQDLIDEDQQELAFAPRLPFTTEHATGQRLAYQFLEESRLPRSGSYKVKNRRGALGLAVGQCVRIWSRRLPRMNGLYIIMDMGDSTTMDFVTMTLKEYDPEIARRYTASQNEQDFDPPPELEAA